MIVALPGLSPYLFALHKLVNMPYQRRQNDPKNFLCLRSSSFKTEAILEATDVPRVSQLFPCRGAHSGKIGDLFK